MNQHSQLQLAFLGWPEIIIIGVVLTMMLAVAASVIAVVAWFATRKSKPTDLPPVLPTASTAACPRCGVTLAAGVAQGLCPKCVLAAGFETRTPTEPESSEGTARPAVPPAADLAQHFPQLEMLELLGRGGMGWVYKARQTNLDRVVALKVLPPDVAKDPAFAERFQREARALARLNHPNIVAIYDFGQAGPYFYFVMEFVDGANLRQLERARRLSPEEAFAIVPKICEALQFAHDEGIVHRDVKPENILIDNKGRVKIADFGIAKLAGKKEDITLTGTGRTLGTPHYMAPEQFETPTKVDHRADIYALGVVFYEMLTGELPMGRFEPPSKHVRVDVRMDEVVLKSLERNPERRYQTVGAVKTDVETISSSTSSMTKPAANPPHLAGPAPAATPADQSLGILSMVSRAWRDWWAERAKWFTLTVQMVVMLAHIACALLFFSTVMKNSFQSPDGVSSRQFTFKVGAGDPWFKFEAYPSPETPFQTGINPVAGSMLYLVAGMALLYVAWCIEKALHPKATQWRLPAPLLILWALWAVSAMLIGTKFGHEAAREGMIGGGHFSPQLRSALAIQDSTSRDQAVQTVAIKAAEGSDFVTVKRAINEIRDSRLHDRSAAECALALAQLGRSADAGVIAGLIRTPSLRDDTLSKIALGKPADPSVEQAPPTASPAKQE